MAIMFKAFSNMYQDSVSLMQLSAQINKQDGIEACSVAMGTPANLTRMQDAGFGIIEAQPNDLVIAVKGTTEAVESAITFATEQLTAKKTLSSDSNTFSLPNNSFELTLANFPDANMALISVPGEYAAGEALKALKLGLNVMMFSDNVSLEDEKLIKTYAQSQNLMVMGPDCGTAIINGIPLGFANVVREGEIGIVAASGTGLQEATCRVHQLGKGISQALGTGGHDLHQSIGGISMKTGLLALIEDKKTQVIILISKPPAKEIATEILSIAEKSTKPIVVHFLGADASEFNSPTIHFAQNLAHSAEIAVALLNQTQVEPEFSYLAKDELSMIAKYKESLAPTQQYIRGVFAGGTFCYEAQLVAKKAGLNGFSNTPVSGYENLADVWRSQLHTYVDLGDDAFTQGRPHPMIDPTLRNERIAKEAQDPETAVVLFDVVIGYGASDTPIDELIKVITDVKSTSTQLPVFIAHVCGTDSDPQNRASIISQLTEQGVLIADCNAKAAMLAVALIQSQA
ncbi:acyl-CoA synthetase FdrA [Thorsellia anophelis]|uniref:CoA binding domain-containing protein n=1 Tax=Thorsellia anophelis DSM 18579 TaxID=1123402 RepID=A0A1I0F8F2_9GAMM|nr:acyl-CoA synthetase FdrA [Thorsellia anophelis]SET54375.1 CoA binding domain-containing protein [Thorsellia anophelis DSM 18579]